MDIQWQLLLTHAVGFLLTLFILYKFAWDPLLSLLDERRNKIKDEFDKIDNEKEQVENLTAEYQGKLKEIDNERRVKITEAVNEGKKIAEEIKSDAKDEAKQIIGKAKGELERDVAKAKVQLKNDMVAMTLTAAERIINEKLDDDKHRELINGFIDDVEKV